MNDVSRSLGSQRIRTKLKYEAFHPPWSLHRVLLITQTKVLLKAKKSAINSNSQKTIKNSEMWEI
jgi:hypothetical protein